MLSLASANGGAAGSAPPAPTAQKPQSAEKPGKANPADAEKKGASAADTAKQGAAEAADASARGDKPADASAQAPDEEQGAAIDPALMGWMAALNLSPTDPAASAKLADEAATGVVGDGDAASEAGRPGLTRAGAGAAKLAAEASAEPLATGKTAGATVAAEAAAQRPTADFHTELAQAAGHEKAELTPASRSDANSPLLAAAPMTAAERSSHTHASAATVAVPQHVQSPEFPQALGVQLSLLAKQGVQQAQLQLNPAEMGPIAVQIALDGSKAQVDFAAASAQTRQILENSLPELASALRDAGLTLSGGGVFQQPRQAPRDGSEGGNASDGRAGARAAGGSGDEPAALVRRTVRVSPGGVDLYA
jgi:flagellar hook-length control protein FliK